MRYAKRRVGYSRGAKLRRGRRVSAARGAPKTRKAFRRRVKKLIRDTRELKKASIYYENNFNSGVTLPVDLIPVLPTINQGDGKEDRDGDKIRGKYIRINGLAHLFNTKNNQDRSEVMVRIAVLSSKRHPFMFEAISDTGSGDVIPQLMRKGVDTSPLNGEIYSHLMDFNTDLVTVHAQTQFRMGIDYVHQAQVPNLQDRPESYVSQDLRRSLRRFSFRIKANKVLKYFDDRIYPENFAPYLVCSYHKISGSPDVLDTAVKLSFHSEFVFTDK